MTSGTLEPASDFAASLRQILEPYILNGYPDISFIADISACSVRALQRRLAECGTTYSKTVERVRFEAALWAMENTDRKLIDIAMDLGYADQSTFTRAFRRWTGVSPTVFRLARHAPADALSSHVI
jgi:AraC-like DNA-binding protein